MDRKQIEKAVRERYPSRKHKKLIENAVREVLAEEKRKEDQELGKTVAGTD